MDLPNSWDKKILIPEEFFDTKVKFQFSIKRFTKFARLLSAIFAWVQQKHSWLLAFLFDTYPQACQFLWSFFRDEVAFQKGLVRNLFKMNTKCKWDLLPLWRVTHESLERRLTKFKFLWHRSHTGVDPSALNPHFLIVQEMGFVWNLAGCWYKLRSTADKSFELWNWLPDWSGLARQSLHVSQKVWVSLKHQTIKIRPYSIG